MLFVVALFAGHGMLPIMLLVVVLAAVAWGLVEYRRS